MSIVNRRNAVLGWGVWTLGKRLGKRKIRQAAPPMDWRSAVAVVGGTAAVAGGVVALRKFA
jgi:hypothetical protein